MKFKTGRNKRITFGFGEGGLRAKEYKETVGCWHQGVDYQNGYGSPVISDNYGIVYKVTTPEMTKSGWCGIYYLSPDGKDWVEICQGHCSEVFVKEGDVVYEGQVIGLEGNKGQVYSRGVRITKEMQENGDKRGSHVHEQFRPVKLVKFLLSRKHYLNTTDGKPFKDKDGLFYEIKNNNSTKGCVNPYLYISETGSLFVIAVNRLLRHLNIIK